MTITTIADLRAALVAGVEMPGSADHGAIVTAMLALSGLDELALARELKVSTPTIDHYARGVTSPFASMRPSMYSQMLGMLPPEHEPSPPKEPAADPLAAKRRMDMQADAESMLSSATFDPAIGALVAQGLRLAVAQAETPDDRSAPARAIRIARSLERLWGLTATATPAPPHPDAADLVAVRVQVNDRASLFEQARAAYLRSGGGQEAGVLDFLGTAEKPKLSYCITEILADADKGDALGFPD